MEIFRPEAGRGAFDFGDLSPEEFDKGILIEDVIADLEEIQSKADLDGE